MLWKFIGLSIHPDIPSCDQKFMTELLHYGCLIKISTMDLLVLDWNMTMTYVLRSMAQTIPSHPVKKITIIEFYFYTFPHSSPKTSV